MLLRVLLLSVVAVVLAAQPARAQDAAAPAPAAAAQDEAEDTDADLNLSQPDFMVITLPTTLRVPRFKGSFRLTHRFTRPLGQGDFGDLIEDFFGLDTGAMIGLGYRFGLARGWQTSVYVVGEVIPRFGYTPGVTHGSFAVEKRAGGHVFQLTFSNGIGTTMGQIARGGTGDDNWYIGFGISRKFF